MRAARHELSFVKYHHSQVIFTSFRAGLDVGQDLVLADAPVAVRQWSRLASPAYRCPRLPSSAPWTTEQGVGRLGASRMRARPCIEALLQEPEKEVEIEVTAAGWPSESIP